MKVLHYATVLSIAVFFVFLQAVSGYSKSYPIYFYNQLIRDLAPLSTMVIELSGHSLILDNGKADGVKTGDLFEVYGKGSPVLKSNTKEIIGYLKRPVATVQVTQAKNNRSICRVLAVRGPLRIGQPAVRYSDMPAAFVSRSKADSGYGLLQKLEKLFPDLIWLNPSNVPSDILDSQSMKTLGIVLLFALEPDGLKVYGPDLSLLHKYPAFKAEAGSLTIPNSLKGPPIGGGVNSWKFKANIKEFNLANAHLIGRLPEETIQIDVLDLDGDGKPEIVYLLPSGIYVSPYRRQGRPISYKFSGPGHPVNFSASVADGWIAINVLLDGVGMRSMVLSYQNSTLRLVEGNINLWLAFIDRDGDKKKESFLGQSFDVNVMFGPKLYLMRASQRGLSYIERIKEPRGFSVIRSNWADLDENGSPELCTVDRRGKLLVYEKGELLWSSPNQISPGLSGDNLSRRLVSLEIHGVGLPDLLFSEVPKERPTLTGDSLMALEWTAGEYVLKAVTPPIGAHICGLAKVQNQLVLGIVWRDPRTSGRKESLLYSFGQLAKIKGTRRP
ncbi:MAG: hypothetical protein GWP10_01635 [Nitrospiraceae bacterium]|nr:hypothetical protein [Nitrospiraceae bacterium]